MKKILIFFLLLVLMVPAFGAVKKATPKPKAKPKVKVTAVKKTAAGVSRAQLTAALGQILASLEAKYSVPLSKDLVLAPSAKPTTRFELAASLAKTLKVIYGKFELALPSVEAVKLKDVKPDHWAAKDIGLVAHFGIMTPYKDKTFKGTKNITRFDLAVTGVRLIENAESAIAALPAKKVKALPPPPSRVGKALEIPSKPQATISSGWGNVYEGGSGTNNWMGFNAAASYGDVFRVWTLSGNYELSGKYSFNQINYILPKSGGGTGGGIVNENRHELEINTIYPVVQFWGISGKLLLGAKYINLSNPTAPSNFAGLNAGLVTGAKIFNRNFLLRGFYSLPLVRAVVSPSVLGQPAQLFDYEASLDAEILSYPVLFGLSGETMTLSGGAYRYYNMFFVRYFLN
jgi:hypothetical protein